MARRPFGGGIETSFGDFQVERQACNGTSEVFSLAYYKLNCQKSVYDETLRSRLPDLVDILRVDLAPEAGVVLYYLLRIRDP